MTTINAQTIINAVMAAHAVAPTRRKAGFFDKIKFKTSARGFHTIHNSKENLQRFADLVKKNARAFGGGLIKEEKQRQAATYATKTISLFKQLIEDHDYSAALALADEKLSPMFFVSGKGVAAMLVAPELFEFDSGFVSVMNECGDWTVTDPVSMKSISGYSLQNKRSRSAQITHVMARYKDITEEKRAAAIESARQAPTDQAASRAAWIAQHGLTEEATTAARIESEELAREEEKSLGQRFDEERAKRKAAREAAAVQDVAQVVAQAVAAVAICDAMAPAEDATTQELATCEAGDAQAQSPTMGNAGTWAPVPQYIPTSVAHINAGQPTQPAFRGRDGAIPSNESPSGDVPEQIKSAYENRKPFAFKRVKNGECFQFSKNGMVFVKSKGGYRPGRGGDFNTLYPDYMVFSYDPAWGMKSIETQADKSDTTTPPAPPAADFAPAGDFGQPTAPEQSPTVPQSETPQDVTDTLETFEAGDGVSFELCEAINRATVAQVQGLTDAQFSKLYDHLENWNFHTENYFLEALRTGDAGIVADMRQVMADQTAAGYLRGDIYDRRNAIAQRIRDAQKAQAAAEASQTSKSGAWTSERCESALSNQDRPTVASKSGKWCAWLYTNGIGTFNLQFEFIGVAGDNRTTTYATTRERMAALQAMARAADAPTDTPTPPAPPAPDSEPAGDLGQASAPEQTPAVPQSETPRDLETDQAEAVAADFERVKPFNLDPRALLANGVEAGQLVGLGVKYTGNMANPDGRGAITAVVDKRSEKWGELSIICTLEDGRVIVGSPHYFTAELRPILQFDSKMHGAPYLAELAMGATLAKSKHTSAKELAKQAHAQALIDLTAQLPQLKRAESTYAGGKLAAVNMRVLLKAAFKGVKFSVTSDYNSVRVVWTDGPTDAQVQAVIGRFDIGASDSQSDYFYTVDTAFSQLFGGVQYLSTYREETDALIQEAINQVYTGQRAQPTVEDYRKAKGVFEWGSTDWQRRQVREALNTISKA